MGNDFDRAKKEITIAQGLDWYSKKIVKGFANECPNCGGHDCCSVTEDINCLNCFSCDLGGSIIDLVMIVDGVDKSGALKLIAERSNFELENSGSVKQNQEQAESEKKNPLRLALQYYKSVRENGSGDKAIKYFLTDRGHFDETMEIMEMGWTDGGLGKALRKEGFTTSELVNHGLVVDKDPKGEPLKQPRDFFWKKGMAVFPVIDHAGKVICLTVKDPEKKFTAQQMKGIKKDWFLNHAALGKHGDLFIVEGQHDMASLIDAGFKNVIGTCGGPGNDQIKKVKNHCAGKTVYLWFDKDPDKDPKKSQGGPAHTRLLYNGLKESSVEVRIIMHPGEMKDPDDFIQEALKGGGKPLTKQVIKELMAAALSPLEWEIELLKLIKNDKDRLVLMRERKIPQQVNAITSIADREVYMDLLATATNRSIKAIVDLLENVQDLYSEIGSAFNGNIKGADPLKLAEYIYNWFEKNAGKFYKTSDGKVWLFYHGKIYEIGDNNPFNALMLRLTRLLKPEKPGSSVWYALSTLCELKGEPVEMMSWVYTCRETDTIYFNLNSPHQKIIKVALGQDPVVIDNGTNENGVLLSTSPQIHEFTYNPSTGEAEGLRALKRHLMDNTPCEMPQQYFLACWTISLFMINFQSDRGLMQIIGTSGLGKSKVAERVSQIVYGSSYVGSGTGAADTRVATKNPLAFADNIENKDLLKGKVDFLLLLATSAMKPKAASGSDTDVVYQKLNSMGMITAIEPFPGRLPELINRTFPLILDGRYRKKDYMHDEVMRAILKDRRQILSAIFKLIGKEVLPKLSERTYWSTYLQSEFAGHNKERMNEHLSTMMIILEALLKYIPAKPDMDVRKQASIMLKDWITYQDEQAAQTEITSNTLLTLMDALQKEICIKIRGRKDSLTWEENLQYFKDDCLVVIFDDPEYMETFYLTESTECKDSEDEESYMKDMVQRFEIIVSSAELSTVFDRFCKNINKRNPFDNPGALGARIANDRGVMLKGGWKYIENKSDTIAPRFKKVKGTYYWRFSKEIVVGRVAGK